MKPQNKKRAAVAAIVVGFVGGFEGLRQAAYYDPRPTGKILTICYGETRGVKPGDYHTKAECDAMLAARLDEFWDGINKCVSNLADMPPSRQSALVSFAYNVGVNAACNSRVVRSLNAGNIEAGCDALLAWDKAAGVTLPGLTRRRKAERELCLG